MIVQSTRENLPPANADCLWVLVHDELARQLSESWSEPVQVRIERASAGDTLVFRRVESAK